MTNDDSVEVTYTDEQMDAIHQGVDEHLAEFTEDGTHQVVDTEGNTEKKAVAKTKDTKPAFTKAEVNAATKLTEKIKTTSEGLVDLVAKAYNENAWGKLGYKTWNAYVDGEFDGAIIQLPKVARIKAVQQLAVETGMPAAFIAPLTGTSVDTAARDLENIGEPQNAEPRQSVTGATIDPEKRAVVVNYITANPNAKPKDVAEYLGDGITASYVTKVKSEEKAKTKAEKAAATKPPIIASISLKLGKRIDSVGSDLSSLAGRDDYAANSAVVEQALYNPIAEFITEVIDVFGLAFFTEAVGPEIISEIRAQADVA